MDRWERDEDRRIQRELREGREAVDRQRAEANADLVGGHAADQERVTAERAEKRGRAWKRDEYGEQLLAAEKRGERLTANQLIGLGHYKEGREAARRIGREDAK